MKKRQLIPRWQQISYLSRCRSCRRSSSLPTTRWSKRLTQPSSPPPPSPETPAARAFYHPSEGCRHDGRTDGRRRYKKRRRGSAITDGDDNCAAQECSSKKRWQQLVDMPFFASVNTHNSSSSFSSVPLQGRGEPDQRTRAEATGLHASTAARELGCLRSRKPLVFHSTPSLWLEQA